MDTPSDSLPVVVVIEGIEYTGDDRILVDQNEFAPDRCQLRIAGDVDGSGVSVVIVAEKTCS
ncbi:hypothetical protein SAMN05216276_107712 [Streptosporangium subroseum]|uniref:Uncharacterized protein n=1 Tax=Streptosporangium subroseum TaxID=106412 RepID=A0A239NZP8_9ACTN|nr:hypothetical protein [Streptosporangium subroseum]SNT60306.1 hypothetical protein SAMN05216276_107712 [Streptosporangium subroseum]